METMTRNHSCTDLAGTVHVSVSRGRHRHFWVSLRADGRVEVRDTSMTVTGRVVGRRDQPGAPFRGSNDAREAVMVALS